jgi:hypothetical protein
MTWALAVRTNISQAGHGNDFVQYLDLHEDIHRGLLMMLTCLGISNTEADDDDDDDVPTPWETRRASNWANVPSRIVFSFSNSCSAFAVLLSFGFGREGE